MKLEIKYCKTCRMPMTGVVKQKLHKKEGYHYVYQPHKVHCDKICQRFKYRKVTSLT